MSTGSEPSTFNGEGFDDDDSAVVEEVIEDEIVVEGEYEDFVDEIIEEVVVPENSNDFTDVSSRKSKVSSLRSGSFDQNNESKHSDEEYVEIEEEEVVVVVEEEVFEEEEEEEVVVEGPGSGSKSKISSLTPSRGKEEIDQEEFFEEVEEVIIEEEEEYDVEEEVEVETVHSTASGMKEAVMTGASSRLSRPSPPTKASPITPTTNSIREVIVSSRGSKGPTGTPPAPPKDPKFAKHHDGSFNSWMFPLHQMDRPKEKTVQVSNPSDPPEQKSDLSTSDEENNFNDWEDTWAMPPINRMAPEYIARRAVPFSPWEVSNDEKEIGQRGSKTISRGNKAPSKASTPSRSRKIQQPNSKSSVTKKHCGSREHRSTSPDSERTTEDLEEEILRMEKNLQDLEQQMDSPTSVGSNSLSSSDSESNSSVSSSSRSDDSDVESQSTSTYEKMYQDYKQHEAKKQKQSKKPRDDGFPAALQIPPFQKRNSNSSSHEAKKQKQSENPRDGESPTAVKAPSSKRSRDSSDDEIGSSDEFPDEYECEYGRDCTPNYPTLLVLLFVNAVIASLIITWIVASIKNKKNSDPSESMSSKDNIFDGA